MWNKIIGTITSIFFMISAWYIYTVYPFTMNLIFTIITTCIVLGIIIRNYFFSKDDKKKEKGYDVVRIIFSAIAIIGFLTFGVVSIQLGGSSVEDSYANLRYENYEVGQYYLFNKGVFTQVSYRTWFWMKVFEQIVIPLFIVTIMWNFLHVARTKGVKFLYTGKGEEVGFTFSISTTKEKIGFVSLFLFLSFICISIIFSLF